MATVQPFAIAVPNAALARLRDKLAAADLPPRAAFADDRRAGAPLSDVGRLAARWRDGFDWRAHEARLNAALPQFTTAVPVDGFGELRVHFVHQKSGRPGSLPLLFCHGWPGSFLEVSKLLPLLTAPKYGPPFDVVAPSLPNFGFSQAVDRPGFSLPQYAECLHRLMLRLGYGQYVTQGGDWGSPITRMMGLLFPDHCLASHVNSLLVKPSAPRAIYLGLRHLLRSHLYSARDLAAAARSSWYLGQGSAYALVQATRPATLAFALADSPVALLAWLYEKLRDWTDDYPWTDDEVLTWVSLYRFSAAGPAASVRIYYEVAHADLARSLRALEYVPRVPLGISHFPKDLIVPPRGWAASAGPVVFEADHAEGGHFAAYECPHLLAADLAAMFGPGGGAHDVARRFEVHHGSPCTNTE